MHVLPKPNSEESHIKFYEFSNTCKLPFVIYPDFELILDPLDTKNKSTHYLQLLTVCEAATILCFLIPVINNKVMLFSGILAIEAFLKQLIKWETKCIEYL